MNAASRGNAYYESNKKNYEKDYGGIEGNKNKKSFVDDINAYINYLEKLNRNNPDRLHKLILNKYKTRSKREEDDKETK